MQSTQHNHSDNASEEEHDHERVDDGEVVDLVVRVALQVHVPAVAPTELGALPFDVVGVDHLYVREKVETGRGGC